MTTKIVINGQINSVHTILNALNVNKEQVKEDFNMKIITFKTKKEAVKALSCAYRQIKRDLEDNFDKFNDNGYYRYAEKLDYDAATAYISE